jgi:hypothetical protein
MLSVNTPLSTFECLNQTLRNLVCLSWHLSPSKRRTSQMSPISLRVCMCMLLSNGRYKRYAVNEYTCNNRIIFLLWIVRIVFYAGRVLSKDSLWVCLCIPLSLLSNGSVNTFPRQQGIAGGVFFYAVYVVSKESSRFILPRTSSIT